MKIILAIAAAAIAVVWTYNKRRAADPVGTANAITNISVSVGVVQTITTGIIGVFEILQMITKPRGLTLGSGISGGKMRVATFGQTAADDVIEGG